MLGKIEVSLFARIALVGLFIVSVASANACGGTGDDASPSEMTGLTGSDVLEVTPPPIERGYARGVPTMPPAITTQRIGDDLTTEVVIKGAGSQCEFTPSEFTFTQGETVTFLVTAQDGDQEFIMREFHVHEEIQAGTSKEIVVLLHVAQRYSILCNVEEGQGAQATVTVRSTGM